MDHRCTRCRRTPLFLFLSLLGPVWVGENGRVGRLLQLLNRRFAVSYCGSMCNFYRFLCFVFQARQ